MFYEPKEGHGLPHNPFKAIVAPRPIGWVGSYDSEGRANLAPYSYFNAVTDDPPMVMLSFSPAPDRERKDSLANILSRGEFTVQIVGEALREAMNISSAPHPVEVSEFEAAGLELAESRVVKAPRVAVAPVSMECVLHETLSLPKGAASPSATIVFGEVVGIHIDDAMLVEGRLDVTRYRPVSRLGYMDYATVADVYEMPRPSL